MTISPSLNVEEQLDCLLRDAWMTSAEKQPLLARVAFMRAIEFDTTGRALNEFGCWLWQRGMWEESLTTFQSLLRQADLKADMALRAVAANNMASVYREMGRSGAAAVFQQQSLKAELSRLESHLPQEKASAGSASSSLANLSCDWGNRANDAILAGDYLLAEKLLQISLRWEKSQGSVDGQAADLGNLGVVATLQGNIGRALVCFRQAWRLHRRCGNQRGWGCDLMHLGLLYSQLGKHKAAVRLLGWAVTELERAGFEEEAIRGRVFLNEVQRNLQVATFDPLLN